MSGFRHCHTDEALFAYRGLPVEQKLEWLEAARQMTADFLPSHRLRAWQRMRGDTAFTIPRDRMLALWPHFQTALDAGLDGLTRLALDLANKGLTPEEIRDLIEDYGEWIKVRTGWTPRDREIWQSALDRLRARSPAQDG